MANYLRTLITRRLLNPHPPKVPGCFSIRGKTQRERERESREREGGRERERERERERKIGVQMAELKAKPSFKVCAK